MQPLITSGILSSPLDVTILRYRRTDLFLLLPNKFTSFILNSTECRLYARITE